MSEQNNADTTQATTPVVEGNIDPQEASAQKFFDNSVTTPKEKPPEQNADQTEKPKEPSAPNGNTSVVPEKYDLKVSDESLFEASALERISNYAREKGLSNEEAQKLVDREVEGIGHYVNSQKEALKRTSETVWPEQLRIDPEVGGANFKANIALAQRAMRVHGTEGLKKVLQESGLGNHPELVKTFVRIGKKMADDELVHSGDQTGRTKMTAEEIFYGKK